jgi:choline-glycine betaine transporter
MIPVRDDTNTALEALQSVSVISEVPVTLLICFYCICLYTKMDAIYTKDMNPNSSEAVRAIEYDQQMGINCTNTNSM